jgi:hypothetical protein
MEGYDEAASPRQDQPPAPRRRGRRWLLLAGLAFAFMLALGIGTLLGSTTSNSQAAALTSGGTSSSQTLTFAQGDANNAQPQNAGPGTQGIRGQCDALTVSSVNGNTIVAKSSNGNSVTIHTAANTQYTQAGKTVTASAVTAGARIHVTGTHNSDGSITATRIDIG